MFFINNPGLRRLEAFMQEVPNFPSKGGKVDLDKLEDEILLFEVENIIVNLKQHKGKEKIMKFRNDQHRSTFLKEANKQGLKNHKLIAALYLLTADFKLWETAKGSVGKDDVEMFQRVIVLGVALLIGV